VWARRAWVLVRGAICWLAAIAIVAAGFIVPLLLTWPLAGDAAAAAMGPPHHDLSDIGPGLIAFFIGGVVGLLAGSIGAAIATLPALALIDRSGVFDKLKHRPETAPSLRYHP
jgi:hypothetical protein